jgi:cytochrome c oxidase subunit 1/cytochrome c oxidase subunit I+III
MPDDSYAPFFLGLFSALLFVGLLLDWRLFTAAMIAGAGLSLTAWMWPSNRLLQRVPSGRTAVRGGGRG